MNVGLFGGTFNPPHLGHLFIAEQVLNFTDIDEVWFLPNYGQNPPKPAADVIHRVAMTTLLVKEWEGAINKSVKVSLLEIDNKLDGNTIHLLPYLPKNNTYKFLMGSDLLPSFHLWTDWEKLLKAISFLVFPRYGFPSDPIYPNMELISDPSLVVSNISSTKIRERVKRGFSIDLFVPKQVQAYITHHGLYVI